MANPINKAIIHLIKRLKEVKDKQDVIAENVKEVLDFIREIKQES